jgi:hypothetical protein
MSDGEVYQDVGGDDVMYLKNIVVDKVLTPSLLGLWYTPVSEEASWNPNAATHTYKILARRRCAGNGGYLR